MYLFRTSIASLSRRVGIKILIPTCRDSDFEVYPDSIGAPFALHPDAIGTHNNK